MNIDGLSLGIPNAGVQNLGVKAEGVQPDTAVPEDGSADLAQFADILSGYSESGALPKAKVQGKEDPDQIKDPSVKENLVALLGGEVKGKKILSDKEKAMQKFMDSMESELGIPPQRFVEAMALLMPQEKLRPPEETISQVIENLNLEPEQKATAKVLYSQMLLELKDASPLRTGMASSAVFQAGEQQHKQILSQSLDRLNDRFFVDGRKPPAPKVEELMDQPQIQPQTKAQMVAPDMLKVPTAAQAASPMVNEVVADELPAPAKDFFVQPTQGKQVAKKLAQAMETGEKISFVPESTIQDVAVTQVRDAQSLAPRLDGTALAAPVTRPVGSEDANLQSILSQAKYVIKQGGGEAIVKLQPEGLGQIHLKVLLKEGQVNVQMQTETKEAQKLLESGVSELRSSLAHQNLNVDSIKVDIGSNSNSDRPMDFQQDMAREQARQFLGQFREQNMRGRDNFFEMEGLRAYNQRKGPEPLAPAPSNSASVNRYAGRGKGEALNLVA